MSSSRNTLETNARIPEAAPSSSQLIGRTNVESIDDLMDRMIIRYESCSLKLVSKLKDDIETAKLSEVLLQKYEVHEYPWSRREKYKVKKGKKVNHKILREGCYDGPNLRAVFPVPLPAAPTALQTLLPMERTDKFAILEKETEIHREQVRKEVTESHAHLLSPTDSKRPKSGKKMKKSRSSISQRSVVAGQRSSLPDKQRPVTSGNRAFSSAKLTTSPTLRPFPIPPKRILNQEEVAKSVLRLTRKIDKTIGKFDPIERDFLGNIIDRPLRPKSAGTFSSDLYM